MKPTLKQAQAQYPYRYTLDHMPAWAVPAREDGSFYATQYASDQEWYDNTIFPEEEKGKPAHERMTTRGSCYSSNPSWPLGKSLKRCKR
jgi:hypothetical protein